MYENAKQKEGTPAAHVAVAFPPVMPETVDISGFPALFMLRRTSRRTRRTSGVHSLARNSPARRADAHAVERRKPLKTKAFAALAPAVLTPERPAFNAKAPKR